MDVRKVPSKRLCGFTSVLILALIMAVILLGGCKSYPKALMRIALLAPFEGRYRESGYNSYYAARLAMQDFADSTIELVPIDDGGSIKGAIDRAKALKRDSLIKVVVALGHTATDAQVQQALGNIPMVVVGDWGNAPDSSHVFALTSDKLSGMTGISDEMDMTEAAQDITLITGGDLLSLAQFPLLRQDITGIRIMSSGSLPDVVFRARYLESAQFVPEPGLLATLTYDAFGMAIQAAQSGDAYKSLTQMNYQGLNGTIQFADGYWVDAPINRYCYEASTPDKSDRQQAVLKPCGAAN